MDIRLLKNTDKIHKNFNGAFDELEECIFKHPEITKVVVFGIAVDADCHIEITDSVSKMLFMAVYFDHPEEYTFDKMCVEISITSLCFPVFPELQKLNPWVLDQIDRGVTVYEVEE